MGHIIISPASALSKAAIVYPAWVDLSSQVAVTGFELKPPTSESETRASTTAPPPVTSVYC